MGLMADWTQVLQAEAACYARIALANIRREFPSGVYRTMNAPGDFPYRPRARTPVFFGSFDWHSCVEMHWLLVRLLRVAPDAIPAGEIRTVLGARFERLALSVEEQYITSPDGLGERPYGWGWALALIHETATWNDPDGRKWAAAMSSLADKVSGLFLEWLPKATYPVRHGVHHNSAFGLSRALPYATERARSGDGRLLGAITAKAHAWFGRDMLYPGSWEPSGQDFLSPALTEAELMAQILQRQEFPEWLGVFLPRHREGIRPRCSPRPTCRTPATAKSRTCTASTRAAPGAGGGSRKACPAATLASDPLSPLARVHGEAALPHVVGDDYMVEHWLAAYAVLMLS